MIKRALIILVAAVIVPWQVARVSPVAAAQPSLSVSPATVVPGGRLSINGSAFTPSANVTVSINTAPTSLSQSFAVPSSGSFSIYFDLPNDTQPGSYTVTAAPSAGGAALASAPFQIPSPSITLNPNPTSPNTTVSVTGAGFVSGAAVSVDVSVATKTAGNRTLQVSATASSAGAFSVSFSLPVDAQPGSYTVHASIGGTVVAQGTLTVLAGPAISLSPATQVAGTSATVSVSGTGFGAGEQVRVQYTAKDTSGNSVVEQGTAVATATGSFVLSTLPVPASLAAGTYTVTATGQSSAKSATATLTVLANPTLSLSPATALPGATVTVSGQHFAANGTVTVSVSIPQVNNTVITQTATATAGAQGSFTTTLQVPVGSALGNVAVQAAQTGNGSTLSARATLTVGALSPSIAVTPAAVLAGSAVAVTGKGFGPGPGFPVTVSGQVNAGGSLQTVSQTVDPDSSGNFTTVLTVPGNATPGTITLYARQQTSGVQATTTFTIEQPTATPTATPTSTPTATATPTALPTATNTPLPTPTPRPRKSHPFKFKSISLWYHTVRAGTYDHLEIQASQKTRVSIWVNILFPSGKHLDYYQRTNTKGHWSKQFSVPHDAIGRSPGTAHIELQLLKGKTDVKTFMTFTVIR